MFGMLDMLTSKLLDEQMDTPVSEVLSLLPFCVGTGATVDFKGQHGRTPLHKAAEKAFPVLIKALCEARADPDSRDHFGTSSKGPGKPQICQEGLWRQSRTALCCDCSLLSLWGPGQQACAHGKSWCRGAPVGSKTVDWGSVGFPVHLGKTPVSVTPALSRVHIPTVPGSFTTQNINWYGLPSSRHKRGFIFMLGS